MARTAPTISHMFFADDSYIFCNASVDSADCVLQILDTFDKASGQQINVDKSSVFFSKNTPNSLKIALCHKLKFKEASDQSMYLGLPNTMGKNISSLFGFLKDRLQNRIQGWDTKTLSKGGKEILLITVAQTLPSYAMGVFLLPNTLCQELDRLMCKYWWKSSTKKDKCIHWKSWSNMCATKANGGIGFRNLQDYNLALLGKQGWRLLLFLDKLVSKVYRVRYFPNGSFLNAKLGCNPSYIWRSVLHTQSLIKQGVGCRVGNGTSINIVEDPWLPLESDPYVHSNNPAIVNQKVSSLFDNTRNWDIDLINDIFDRREADLILTIPVNSSLEDSWYWRREKLGDYTVKSAYLYLQDLKNNYNVSSNSGFWRKLWNLKIPPKV